MVKWTAELSICYTSAVKKYEAWFAQARKDLLWGESSLLAGHYAQTCFIAQQVAEKALKSLAFYRGFDLVKSHSVVQILNDLKVNGQLVSYGRQLDLYYLSTRYPDALPDNSIPSNVFDVDQAKSALEMARAFIQTVQSEIGAYQ